jgi:hypothetical protein
MFSRKSAIRIGVVALALAASSVCGWRAWVSWTPTRPIYVGHMALAQDGDSLRVKLEPAHPSHGESRLLLASGVMGGAALGGLMSEPVAVTLEVGDDLAVTSSAPAGAMPVIAVGAVMDPLPTPAGPRADLPLPLSLDASGKALGPAGLGRPWTAFSLEQQALAAHCPTPPGEARAWRVHRDQSSVTVGLGDCQATTPVGAAENWVVLATSGPARAMFESADPARPVAEYRLIGPRRQWALWAGTLVAVVGLVAACGWLAPHLVPVLVIAALVSAFDPALGFMLWCTGLVAVVVVLAAYRFVPRPFHPLVGVGAMVAAPFAIAALLTANIEGDRPPVVTPQAACVVVGYSAAFGISLDDPQHEALHAALARRCPKTCPTAGQIAGDGRTLSWLVEQARVQQPQFPDGVRGLIYAGFNDYVNGLIHPDGVVAQLVALRSVMPGMLAAIFFVSFGADPAEALGAARIERFLGGRPIEDFEHQAVDLRTIRDRFAASHGVFGMIHDGLVGEMAQPLGAARRLSEQAKLDAVSPGYRWSLMRDFDAVGPAWFNDLIHPSAYGYHHMAERIGPAFCPQDFNGPPPDADNGNGSPGGVAAAAAGRP